MSLTSLSAGTGPAAAILIGGLLILANHSISGIVIMLAGVGLSLLWALR